MPSPLNQSEKEFIRRVFSETNTIKKTQAITKISRNTIRKVVREREEALTPAMVKSNDEEFQKKKQLWSDSYSSVNELFSTSRFNFFAGELPELYRLRVQSLISVLKEEFDVELIASLNFKVELLAEQLLTYKKYQLKVVNMLRQSDDNYQSVYKASPIQYAKAVCGFETCANNALKMILRLLDDLEAHGQRLRVQKQVTTTFKNGVVTHEKVQNSVIAT
jgi:hypothetical protein